MIFRSTFFCQQSRLELDFEDACVHCRHSGSISRNFLNEFGCLDLNSTVLMSLASSNLRKCAGNVSHESATAASTMDCEHLHAYDSHAQSEVCKYVDEPHVNLRDKLIVITSIKPATTCMSVEERVELSTRQSNSLRNWLATFKSHFSIAIYLFGNVSYNQQFIKISPRNLHVMKSSNESSIPLFDDMINQVRSANSWFDESRSNLFLLTNADILFSRRTAPAALAAMNMFSERPFLLVGQRFDIPMSNCMLDFEASNWDHQLQLWEQHPLSFLQNVHYKDFFFFSDALWNPHISGSQIAAPVVIGRAGYDDWIMKSASQAGAAIVDLTPAVRVYHQSHSYNHLAGGKAATWNGGDAQTNYKLLGSAYVVTEIDNAPFELQVFKTHHTCRSVHVSSRINCIEANSSSSNNTLVFSSSFRIYRRKWASIKSHRLTLIVISNFHLFKASIKDTIKCAFACMIVFVIMRLFWKLKNRNKNRIL